jgi:hypothetical protein
MKDDQKTHTRDEGKKEKGKTQQGKKKKTNRRETIEDSLRIYTWKEKGIEPCLLHIYLETGRHHDDYDDGSN